MADPTPDPENPVVRPMAGRRRDFVRLEIERAGMDLFARHGYGNVTIQEVATAAGIGRRTFFHHFQSKDELLQAFDNRLALRALRAYQERPPDEPAAEALCHALLSPAAMSAEDERVAYQRIKVLQEAGAERIVAGHPEVAATFIDETRRRLEASEDRDLRAYVLVFSVFAAARAAGRVWIADGGRGTLEERLSVAFDELLRGLGHRGPGRQGERPARRGPSRARPPRPVPRASIRHGS